MTEQTWQERLAEILKKEPAALTPGDIEFLRARRSYLNPEQAKLYADALEGAGDEAEEDSKGKKKAK